MPSCKSCGHQWSWKQTFIKAFRFNSRTKCSNCGKEQFVTSKTRRRSSLLAMVGVVPLILVSFLDLSLPVVILIVSLVFILVFMLIPFIIELTDKNEHLW